ASSWHPPSAVPTKLTIVRSASCRTSAGISCHCESARKCASCRVTSVVMVSPSEHEITAVDGDCTPGHPARLVGGKKEDRSDDILGLARPAEWELPNSGAATLGIVMAAAGQSGQSWTRGDRVDANAPPCQFKSHRVGQRPAAAFRRDIGGALGAGDLGELRC